MKSRCGPADPPLRSPGELRGAEPDVLVGGRARRQGSEWRLCDALAAVPVVFGAHEPPEEALCRVEGEYDGATLRAADVRVEALAARPPEELAALRAGRAAGLVRRARVLGLLRRFFEARGFLEVETPLRSRERSLEAFVDPIASGDRHLITSPELHMKRLLAGGLPRIFQLARCFRRDECGPLHNPEFTLLEWYRAYATMQDVLQDTEQLVAWLCEQLHGGLRLPLRGGREIDLQLPFPRLSVREAFRRYAGCDDAPALAARDESEYFQLLVDAVEPALAALDRPVFLVDYPISQAALARPCPSDGSVAERFELQVAGVELCNGYGELTDATAQRQRFELERQRRLARGEACELPERFLAALEQGMPPAGGNALGVDRLVALLGGQRSLSEVLAFPEPEA